MSTSSLSLLGVLDPRGSRRVLVVRVEEMGERLRVGGEYEREEE